MMIIQRRGGELWLIRQPDHAALAARIMAEWRLDGLPGHPRRAAILTATREHDAGWQDEDEETHVDEHGEPLDFVAVPAAIKQRIWPRAIERLAARDPYVAALVAQHGITIYQSLRDDPAWQAYFARMEETRDALAARAGLSSIDDDYPFVRIGDLVSLVFCNAWTTETAVPSGSGCRAILSGNTLTIDPDPFAGRRIPLRVEARVVPARTYPSAAALRAAFAAAAPVALEGVAAGA